MPVSDACVVLPTVAARNEHANIATQPSCSDSPSKKRKKQVLAGFVSF